MVVLTLYEHGGLHRLWWIQVVNERSRRPSLVKAGTNAIERGYFFGILNKIWLFENCSVLWCYPDWFIRLSVTGVQRKIRLHLPAVKSLFLCNVNLQPIAILTDFSHPLRDSKIVWYVTGGFRRGVNEVFALLGCYAELFAQGPLMTGPIGCSETSVTKNRRCVTSLKSEYLSVILMWPFIVLTAAQISKLPLSASRWYCELITC